MSLGAAELEGFLNRTAGAVLVTVSTALGSTPREAGAFMLVSAAELVGTIGGGQLEYLAIDAARKLLRDPDAPAMLDVPLGPEIGQCCGGRVALSLQQVTAEVAANLSRRLEEEEARKPTVLVLGAGHVGHALAHALALLPVRTTIIDTRPEALDNLPAGAKALCTAIPEAEVRAALPGSAFVVLTHEHSLDFLIAREALKRADAAYVGMIGSKTKRAAFRSWLKAEGEHAGLADRLVCPIGGNAIHDKRPEVIAALAAAEILVHTGPRVTSQATGVAAGKSGNG